MELHPSRWRLVRSMRRQFIVMVSASRTFSRSYMKILLFRSTGVRREPRELRRGSRTRAGQREVSDTVAGGYSGACRGWPGKHSAIIPTFGFTEAISFELPR